MNARTKYFAGNHWLLTGNGWTRISCQHSQRLIQKLMSYNDITSSLFQLQKRLAPKGPSKMAQSLWCSSSHLSTKKWGCSVIFNSSFLLAFMETQTEQFPSCNSRLPHTHTHLHAQKSKQSSSISLVFANEQASTCVEKHAHGVLYSQFPTCLSLKLLSLQLSSAAKCTMSYAMLVFAAALTYERLSQSFFKEKKQTV